MNPSNKVATFIPLTELWDDTGPVPARRLRYLNADEIKDILRSTPFRFVIADVGEKLRWIDDDERFDFWKHDLKDHLCSAEPCLLESYPGEYFYYASEWLIEPDQRAVLLEKYH